MASLNQCNFIGNIGKIETRYLNNGDAITNCSIAVNESYKDKEGNKQEKVEWVNITAYRKLAEIMSTYCAKGMQIYVSGKMSTRKYTDKDGIERYTTQIIAEDMKMLGNRSAGSTDQSEPDNKPTPPAARAGASNTGAFDDIPF